MVAQTAVQQIRKDAMTPHEKTLLTAKINYYFNKSHGVKIQAAYAEFTKKRSDLLAGTSVFDNSIDYYYITKKVAHYREEFNKVESTEILEFDDLKKAIVDLHLHSTG